MSRESILVSPSELGCGLSLDGVAVYVLDRRPVLGPVGRAFVETCPVLPGLKRTFRVSGDIVSPRNGLGALALLATAARRGLDRRMGGGMSSRLSLSLARSRA